MPGYGCPAQSYQIDWRADMTGSVTAVIAFADWWERTVNYEIIRGNATWRFGLVLLIILVGMAAG